MIMKLAIAGAGGRMGRELARIVNDTPGCVLAGGLEAKGSAYVGMDYGTLVWCFSNLGVKITDDVTALMPIIDGIIDFTIPAATLDLCKHTADHGKVHVIGTTGIDAAGEATIAWAAQRARIVKSGNYSLGINLLQGIVKKVASTYWAMTSTSKFWKCTTSTRLTRHRAPPSCSARPQLMAVKSACRPSPCAHATVTPVPARQATSALPPCAVARSWVITP